MKFCSNCGGQIDEKAVICVKCGVPVAGKSINQTQNTQIEKASNGVATASMVLGILALIASVITIIITIGVVSYTTSSFKVRVYSTFSSSYDAEKIALAFGLTAIPGILALIGLPLGIFCRRGGAKIAGIVLNLIAIVICVIQFVMIMGM